MKNPSYVFVSKSKPRLLLSRGKRKKRDERKKKRKKRVGNQKEKKKVTKYDSKNLRDNRSSIILSTIEIEIELA